MAVYTEVPDNELRAFVEQYDIGEVMATGPVSFASDCSSATDASRAGTA